MFLNLVLHPDLLQAQVTVIIKGKFSTLKKGFRFLPDDTNLCSKLAQMFEINFVFARAYFNRCIIYIYIFQVRALNLLDPFESDLVTLHY